MLNKKRLILFLATGFGFGQLRPAPGTWGTLPGVAIAAMLMSYPLLLIVVTLVLFTIGVYLAREADRILNQHDDGRIVIDEIVGVMITFWFFEPTWSTLLIGFVWFRLFDIAKPYPIKTLDRHVSGGFGVMIDDVVAGIFAWLALHVSLLLLA